MMHKSFKRNVQGATLIEVIVSMFLLTFGVLGLMAVQIRSVASIGEAESRSTISQAAENLAEGMQINPTIQVSGGYAVRRYDTYLTAGDKETVTVPGTTALPAPLFGGSGWTNTSNQQTQNITKQALAANQLALFRYMLEQTPNAISLQYVICEESNYPPRAPTVDDNGNITSNNCSAKGHANNSTVIKVVWATPSGRENQKPNVYTYQLQVPK